MQRLPPILRDAFAIALQCQTLLRMKEVLANKDRLDVFGDTAEACATLAKKDACLARALDAIGEPHIRRRPGGFEALFRIIVEQQVSVPSAQAIWARCQAGMDPSDPDHALHHGEEGLRGFGLSTPKARYVTALAGHWRSGGISEEKLAEMSDEEAAAALQEIKGIGPWTAAIYLLFCEGRVDIWPPGDVALLGAYRAARRRGPEPDMKFLDSRAQKWRPYRGLAAHILWTYYAHLRGRAPI
ncbi:DNA-3-methyladenine glycosylase family protein [Hyphococcus luteus]|uniref:DNA-3-methyladenine glycosylase II n=1 Tax=Hyphococcus luteus TaxID=2058213 RepID=A0A2S7K7P4_9PROT|nr:DNA-3-methyladenine glycosylase [Marinicaulis flavus]PQA88534.1 DNA-3-methyladenine glycosylase 2 family protein [Marinicaulis flavus]